MKPISFLALSSMRSILASYLGIFLSGGRMLCFHRGHYEMVRVFGLDRKNNSVSG